MGFQLVLPLGGFLVFLGCLVFVLFCWDVWVAVCACVWCLFFVFVFLCFGCGLFVYFLCFVPGAGLWLWCPPVFAGFVPSINCSVQKKKVHVLELKLVQSDHLQELKI